MIGARKCRSVKDLHYLIQESDLKLYNCHPNYYFSLHSKTFCGHIHILDLVGRGIFLYLPLFGVLSTKAATKD